MEKLLEILIALPIKTVVDYLLIIVPIVLSCIAIAISIVTTSKQNKIALFELRYKCYSQLRTIRSFDASTHDCDDPRLILKMFDALWGTGIAKTSGEECLIRCRCQMEIIVHDVLQREFLFRHRFDTDFSEILKYTQKVLMAATGGTIDVKSQKELHRLCELLEKKDVRYMCRKLKI